MTVDELIARLRTLDPSRNVYIVRSEKWPITIMPVTDAFETNDEGGNVIILRGTAYARRD